MERTRRIASHLTQALAEAGLIAMLVVGLIAGTTFAAAGGKGAATSTAVHVEDGVYAGTTTAHAGPSNATWVRARCYQDGKQVYEQYRQFDVTRAATLTLGPTPNWTGGSASCTAQDGYWRRGTTWRVTSTSSFNVAG